jgi:hypothetical protein
VEAFPADRGDPRPIGFDASVEFQPDWERLPPQLRRTDGWARLRKLRLAEAGYARHRVYDYRAMAAAAQQKPDPGYPRIPCVMPGWDNSARRQQDAVIFINSDPARYSAWLEHAVERAPRLGMGERLVFINAWNEWGEGCYLEPDATHGRAYLEATQRALRAGAPQGSAP